MVSFIPANALPQSPSHRSDTHGGERDANGRLFKTYPSGFLRLIFERLGFSLMDQWGNSDAMNRQGIEWVFPEFCHFKAHDLSLAVAT